MIALRPPAIAAATTSEPFEPQLPDDPTQPPSPSPLPRSPRTRFHAGPIATRDSGPRRDSISFRRQKPSPDMPPRLSAESIAWPAVASAPLLFVGLEMREHGP